MSDDIRLDPMPDYADGTLDFERVAQLVGEAVHAVDDELHHQISEAIQAEQCRWALSSRPDEHGYFTATLLYIGGDFLGTVRIHWSRLVE
jgi:hypothetical protein